MKKRTFFQRALAWVLVFIMVIGGVTVPGINTLQAKASALGESGGETNSPEINGSGAGGETTGAATPETYTADIVSERNEYYPEEPVTLTAQVKNSSGNVIPMDGITVTWSITTGADSASLSDALGSSTHLTVNKDVAKGTSVEVKVQCKNGDSSVDCEKTLSLNTSVRETVTVSGKVYDSYAPGGTHTAIPGAEITFEQSAAQVNKQVKVTAGNDGSYSVTLYKGIPYSVHIVKSDYQVFKQTGLSFLADTNNNDIHMEISGSLAISGTNEILVDQTVQLTAAVTGKLDNVSWEIISANKNDATLSPVAGSGGKNADFKALKAGTYEVKVSAHGIESDSFVINVKKKTPVLEVTINPEKDGNWYSGVAINAALTDGDKKLSNQTINIYIDGTKVGSMTTDNNGDATYTWKEAKGVVKDTYSIEVKYGGNTDYYSEAVWGSANYSLSKLGQSFEFDGSNTVDNLTYGDVSYIKLKDILPDSSVTGADRENYKASTNFTFEVNDAGKDFVEVGAFDSNEGGYPVNVKKGGVSNVKITVTQEANEFYNASQKEMTITSINKKEVSLVDVQAEEKTYDGLTDNIKVTAKLNLADIEDVDKTAAENVKMLSIANGSVDKADAASQAAVTAKFEMPQSLADKYYLKGNGEIPANTAFVKIKPAPLSLTLGNASIDYSLIPDVSALEYEDNVEKISVSGLIGDDLINNPLGFQLPNIYIDTEALGTEFEVEKSYDVLKAEENTGNSTNNYYFDFDNQSPGKLTLLVESVKIYSDYIAYDDSGSKSASQDNDTLIYYGDNQPVVKFKILSEKEKNYSQIILVKDGQVSGNIAETGIEDLGTNDSEVSYQAYLINDKGTKKTSVFDLPAFKRDGKKPNVSITIAEDNKAFDEFLETLTFGLYHNTSMKADISVADPVVEGLSSGVRSWSYYIAEVDEDVTFTPQATDYTLTEEEFKNRFPDAAFETIDVNSDDDLKKTISIGDKGNNNYIVFVIAVDKVGNCCLYGSNGVIIENIHLNDILINYNDQTKTDHFDDYFKGDVWLDVNVTENTDGIYSGIRSVKYDIKKDDDIVVEDVSLYEVSDENIPNTTLESLKNGHSSRDFTVRIPKEDGVSKNSDSSKKVFVTFNAMDFAGNSRSVNKEFVIDPVAPKIENSIASEASAKHGKYYNKPVTLTTTITERFLDVENDLKYSFNGVDGISLKKLQDKPEDYGISEINITYINENGGQKTGEYDESLRSDSSLTIVEVTFDTDAHYNVSTSVSDKAGNSAVSDGALEFVVDKNSDEGAELIYYGSKDGINYEKLTYIGSILYFNEQYTKFKAVIEVKESNFVLTDGTDNEVVTDLNVVAIKSTGERILENELAEIKTNVKNSTKWIIPDPDKPNIHQYVMEFNQDANYSFEFYYTDLAGNSVSITEQQVTLDKFRPLGTVTIDGFVNNGSDKSKSWMNSFISLVTFGLFGKNDLKASMVSSDITSGVATTEYYILNLDSEQKKALSRDDLRQLDVSGNQSIWSSYEGVIKLPPDKNYVIYEKVTDKAGNVEYYSTDNFVADATSPAPIITIEPTEASWRKGIYRAEDKPGFYITVTDPDSEGSYSGLKSVSYEILDETNKVSEKGETTFERNQGQQSLSNYVKINPDKFNSNEVKITVKAIDWSGNDASSEKRIKIDSTAPEVKFNFNSADVLNDKYYKNTKELEIIVTDLNFDTDYSPTVTSTLGMDYSFSGWNFIGNEQYRGVLTFRGNSDYTVSFDCYDLAGNKSNTAVQSEFTVDTKTPEVVLSESSEAKKLNGKYYNKNVTLKTVITERCMDIDNKVVYTINDTEVTLAELKANPEQYGILSINESDIIHQLNEKKRDDQSQSIINITFKEDNEYNISAAVTDKAGNRGTSNTINFVVDQTAPEATLTYYSYGKGDTFTAGTGPDNITYLGQDYSSFAVEVTVEELNFTLGGTVNADFTSTAINSKGDSVGKLGEELTGYTVNGKKADTWTSPGETTHKYRVNVQNDANYTFDFAYTDLAGNPLKVNVPTGYVTLDKTLPEGTVIIDGLVNGTGENGGSSQSWANKFIASITFGLFGKNDMSATMTSGDETAGVSKMEYLTSSEFLTKDALAGRTEWTGYTSAVSLAANQNVIVYEKVTDKAGNVEYFSTQNLVADNVDPAPTVTITPSSPAWGKGVYSAGDTPGFDISVTDPVVNDAYSGLKEITYKIVNGTNGDTESGTLATFGNADHQQSWTGHVSINPERFYSNDVQVTVYASDWSTNEATSETARLKVDNKAPIVKFSFDTSDVLNGKYYKNNKTLIITVDERNFDPSYTPTVTSTAGGGYSFNGWSTNGEITTGTITFSGDSDYTVTFDCYDLAGNKSNTERQEEFTVDKTLPVINVAYDNNSALNGNYYKASRTATVTITEHNFRASEVRVTTTASLDGKAILAPTAGGWSSYGDRHTAVISYPADGDYTFDITYTDLAGNASTDYAMDSFTVDLTNPEIEITGIKDKSANKGTVAPVITFTDVNFATENVTLTLTGANKGKVPVDGMVSRANRNNGTTVTFKNFGKDMDDIYTLTAKTTDKAGNETSKSISFSVNRNGSTYEIDSATQAMLKSGFTNNPKDIVIKEINVDTLEFIEITYSKDGKVVKLKEGTDYIVKAEGGEGQWKKYTYTIKAECFEEEGEYSINIYSEDRATNTSTNKVKAKNLEFIVDKTPPTVSIANLENRGRYREDIHQFTLSVKDNTVLSYVELYIDGELVRTYSGDELTVVDGVITIDVDSRSSYQNIRLIAYDAAGNPTEPMDYEVLVTSSWWVQFFMNKPLFFGCIAALLIVAAGAALLVVKVKKKR